MTRHCGRRLLIGGLLLAAAVLPACAPAARPLPARPVAGATAPPAPAAPRPAAGTSPGTLTSGGEPRRYRLHVPPGAAAGAPLPLVVNLHGYNSDAAQQEALSRMSAQADAAGFVAVYPEGRGEPARWAFGSGAEAADDVQFIRDLVRQIEAQLPIDPRRVYVTGISNGAELGYRLMCDAADTFAAAALVAGGYPPFRDCRPARPVPVVAFHGTADRLLPYEGQPPALLPVHEWAAGWAARNGCAPAPAVTLQRGEVTGETWGGCREGAGVVLYTIAGKGHSWPGSAMPAAITTRDVDATDVIWAFFAAHPRP